MVVLLVWQQLASISSVVAMMAQLVVAETVAVVASSTIVEKKMQQLPPAWHTIADRNKNASLFKWGEQWERTEGVGRGRKAGHRDVLTRKLVRIKQSIIGNTQIIVIDQSLIILRKIC